MNDVRAAFESRGVLRLPARDLEELLAAVGCETIQDPAARAQAREMGETLRLLLEDRRSGKLRRSSKISLAAVLLAVAALMISAAQVYRSWGSLPAAANSPRDLANLDEPMPPGEGEEPDSRTQVTLAELAKRAPTLRTGTLQAWWAGEQARQVQRYEALAKQQALAGDREGAAHSVRRADAIRSRIPSLAEFEKPGQR